MCLVGKLVSFAGGWSYQGEGLRLSILINKGERLDIDGQINQEIYKILS